MFTKCRLCLNFSTDDLVKEVENSNFAEFKHQNTRVRRGLRLKNGLVSRFMPLSGNNTILELLFAMTTIASTNRLHLHFIRVPRDLLEGAKVLEWLRELAEIQLRITT